SQKLEALGRAPPAAAAIDVLVNTHANGDHCYGNQLVEGAHLAASKHCAEEMSEVPAGLLAGLVASAPTLGAAGEFLSAIFGGFDFAGIDITTPDQTFEGDLELRVGDRVVRLLEVGPAHTRGDVVVHVPDAAPV